MNLLELAQMTEDEARTYMENLRWPEGPVCPHCQSQKVTRLEGTAHRSGTIQCNDCREQFTVTVGSVMESSKIPLLKWVMAFHLMCSSKKGVSALQLQRDLGLGSYRTAWFMCHRIRLAMEGDPMQTLLKGEVEVDETYVGGKARGPRGRGAKKKTPVMVLVERNSGNVVCKPVSRVNASTLKTEILENVDTPSTIITDEFRSYTGIGKHFDGGHKTIKHKDGRYVRKTKKMTIHTNTAESFFALIKRGHYGIFHQLSKKHLHRYCSEFAFRWTHRKVSDGKRTEAAISQIGGKRLMYQ